MDQKINNFLIYNKLITRPGVGHGLWLGFLLPIAIINSYYQNLKVATEIYQTNVVLSYGLLISSIVIFLNISKKLSSVLSLVCYFITTVVIASILHLNFFKGFMFSCLSGALVTFAYRYLLFKVMSLFPYNFSLGESVVCTQGFILFLFSSVSNIKNGLSYAYKENGKISVTIIQVGLLGLSIICLSTYLIKILRQKVPFYIFTITCIFLFIFFPLHMILKRSPLLWIFNLFFSQTYTIFIFVYWFFCCILATFAVRKQIADGKKASTGIRKIFHFLAVFVYLPGLLFTCDILYLASGVVLGLFIGLELLRILKIEPVGSVLQEGFLIYSDEKDVGVVALTPIYLLVGCSLPLWIHPDPCDILNSAGFNLLPLTSGLLTIGIGDAAASIFGKIYGKHKWPGSQKSYEGTLACILSQFSMIYIINICGYTQLTRIQIGKAIGGVFITSIVEACTDQIDNLVLPFIMYIILV